MFFKYLNNILRKFYFIFAIKKMEESEPFEKMEELNDKDLKKDKSLNKKK